MAADGWCPFAIDNWAADDGGPFVSLVTVGVLHKTISRPGSFRANPNNYFGHQSYPHFTVDVQNGSFKVWQHISIRRAAKALRNMPGGVQTNREGSIQVEIVGWADSNPDLHPEMVKGLAKLMRWVESETDIPPSTGVQFYPYPPPNGARLGREPWRMGFNEWVNYKGWCAHQHTPENTHGDTGALDIKALLPSKPSPVFKPKPPKIVPADPIEDDMPNLYIVTDNRGDKPQYVTDLLTKRWIQNPVEYKDIIEAVNLLNKPRKLERIVLEPATLDAIPTVGTEPFVMVKD